MAVNFCYLIGTCKKWKRVFSVGIKFSTHALDSSSIPPLAASEFACRFRGQFADSPLQNLHIFASLLESAQQSLGLKTLRDNFSPSEGQEKVDKYPSFAVPGEVKSKIHSICSSKNPPKEPSLTSPPVKPARCVAWRGLSPVLAHCPCPFSRAS